MHASAFCFFCCFRVLHKRLLALLLYQFLYSVVAIVPLDPTGILLEEQEERRTAFVWAEEEEPCTAYPPTLFCLLEEEKANLFDKGL